MNHQHVSAEMSKCISRSFICVDLEVDVQQNNCTYTAVACMHLDGTTALINDDEKMQCIDFVLP
jgi:hypothetical protein